MLKPCSNCGGKTHRDDTKSKGIEGVVWCDNCSHGIFISNYNNRPIEDALKVRVEELEGMLERLRDRFKYYLEHDKLSIEEIDEKLDH